MLRPDDIGTDRSLTTLLDGRVQLMQPDKGYRTAIDAVFLAAFCLAENDDHVLDVGCGNGSAGFCLAARQPHVHVTGLELQSEFSALAEQGVIANGFDCRYRIFNGDLLSAPRDIVDTLYDHVIANPPYMKSSDGNQPKHANQITATVEGGADLNDWLSFLLKRTKPGGTVTVIHRADRLPDIMAWFRDHHASLTVLPILPTDDRPANRVLVRAVKSSKARFQLRSGLVVHDGFGEYSEMARKILLQAHSI